MEMVTRWRTSDGKEHETKAAAKRHEAGIKAHAALAALLAESVKTGRIESVLRHIVVESAGVRAILAAYAKQCPREGEDKKQQNYRKIPKTERMPQAA